LLPNRHPGETLTEEFLMPMGSSQNALARALKVPRGAINEIILGKRSIAADADLRLTGHFGLSDGFFPGLRTDFELMKQPHKIGGELGAIGPRAARPGRQPESTSLFNLTWHAAQAPQN